MEHIEHEWATEIRLTNDEARSICKLGQGAPSCAFLVVGRVGYECIRMSPPMSATIFARLEDDIMNAKGLGCWPGCPWSEGEAEYHEEVTP